MAIKSKSNQAYAALLAGAISLGVFGIVNICKEVYSNVKSLLNFYSPVGPLLGLFVIGVLVFIISFILLSIFMQKPLGDKAKKTIVIIYIVSTILFLFMVFPPVFEPLVEILSIK